MTDVCVVGSLHYDIMVRAAYLPRTGETLIGERWWWKPGGKGGNQAMAAARHGASVEMVGSLGDDEFGTRLRERLAAAGVGHSSVRAAAQGTGMSVAIEQSDGDYAAVVVSGANRETDEVLIETSRSTIERCRVIVLQNEIPEAANIAAARLAREAGTTVILNAAPARPSGAMTGLVDVLAVNAVEAEMSGTDPVTSLDAAAAGARSLGHLAPVVVVTAGDAGVAAAAGPDTFAIGAYRVETTETHGAGDVFVGALAAQLAGSTQLEDALRYANAAAALHVSTPEAQRDGLGPTDVGKLLSGRADG